MTSVPTTQCLRFRQLPPISLNGIWIVDQFFGHALRIEFLLWRLPNWATFEHSEFLLAPFGRCVALQQRKQFPAIVSVCWCFILEQKSKTWIVHFAAHYHCLEQWTLANHKFDHPMNDEQSRSAKVWLDQINNPCGGVDDCDLHWQEVCKWTTSDAFVAGIFMFWSISEKWIRCDNLPLSWYHNFNNTIIGKLQKMRDNERTKLINNIVSNSWEREKET